MNHRGRGTLAISNTSSRQSLVSLFFTALWGSTPAAWGLCPFFVICLSFSILHDKQAKGRALQVTNAAGNKWSGARAPPSASPQSASGEEGGGEGRRGEEGGPPGTPPGCVTGGCRGLWVHRRPAAGRRVPGENHPVFRPLGPRQPEDAFGMWAEGERGSTRQCSFFFPESAAQRGK